MAPAPPPDDSPVVIKMFTAGFSGCVADFLSFPLDTAKVRLQVQGEAAVAKVGYAVGGAPGGVAVSPPPVYRGVYSTIATIIQREGPKALYNGLSAGLQRQMAFASVRIGLYDSVKEFYIPYFSRSGLGGGLDVGSRIAAGITTGAMAVMLAQPTDVVKVRMQAQAGIYKSTLKAYAHIGKTEGVMKGLWRGTIPNISRNAIVNVAEIVVYDIAKDIILNNNWMKDDVPCHFLSAVIAGFCATAAASPVDVVKTRYMNAPKGKYRGALDCTIKMAMKEGPSAFYKGFAPSFCRIVSWNIFMWVTYEQVKKAIAYHKKN